MIRAVFFLSLISLTLTANAFEPFGTYRGGWRSDTTGHEGPMRVKLTPRSDGTYRARFSGRFAKIIPFTYQTTMTPVDYGPGYTKLFSSKQMPLFGAYHTTAVVTPHHVDARYQSKRDHGSFSMSRQ